MHIKRKIKFSLLFEDSWHFLTIIGLWSAFIIYLHDYVGLGIIAMPIIPLSTLGIAVSLYLGFRSKESYERWWEVRKIWGDIINKSRSFSNQIHRLLYTDKYQLRSTSRFTAVFIFLLPFGFLDSFEGATNDLPLSAMVKTIEIDL